MKRFFGIITAALLAGSFAIVTQGPADASSRTHALHVTKECSQYTGAAGSFCTIKSSNLRAIKPGAKVVYASAINADGTLVSAITVDNGHGNVMFGHVSLTGAGMFVTFSGGTGKFEDFRASAIVSVTDGGTPMELWHWDGTYSFSDD
jgi:hypothetical protein